jgi:hypothetical protein
VVDDGDLVRELIRFFEVLRRQEDRRPLAPQVADVSQISLRLRGSRPVVGSSRKSTCGMRRRLDLASSLLTHPDEERAGGRLANSDDQAIVTPGVPDSLPPRS